jgi:energy-coupling factor transport system permease protein
MNANIFVDGRGFLYKIDPRAKVIATLISCIYVFTPVSFYSIIALGIFFILLSFYSIGKKQTKNVIKSILPMLIIMLLFSPLYERDGSPLWIINNLLILTKEGLIQSLLLDFRFLSITFACSLLFTTTKMDEFMLALQDFKLPYKASLTISLVFRSIPSIFDSFVQIIDSHKLRRGVDNKANKKLSNRIRNLFPTMTSALVVSLRSIPTLAMSLEARGYGLKRKRTNFHTLEKYSHPFLQTVALLTLYGVMFFIFKK